MQAKVTNVQISFDFRCPICDHEENFIIDPSRVRAYPVPSGWSDVDDGFEIAIDFFKCPRCERNVELSLYRESY